MSDFKEFCRSQPLIYCREISCSLCKRNREATTKLQSKIEELEAKLFVCDYPLRYILSHEGLSEDIIHCISEALEKIKGIK